MACPKTERSNDQLFDFRTLKSVWNPNHVYLVKQNNLTVDQYSRRMTQNSRVFLYEMKSNIEKNLSFRVLLPI